ncbi:MAG: phosphoribosylamine--glycine ligase [Candidatus Thorarchaeota archaeon]|nr:phosphoribosylamine--glycine ligase [Candidatus Thorarchaeota archaeon]
MTRVLLVGSGAREHAIAAALKRSDVTLWTYMDRLNPGIAALAAKVIVGPLNDPSRLPDLAGVDYAVIGPEVSLAAGFCDQLEKRGIPCVGPCKTPAQIETSKVWARTLLAKAAPQANPVFRVVTNEDEFRSATRDIGLNRLVVKPDGLTGGKGVRIYGEHFESERDVHSYCLELLKREGRVLLEERLVGAEFTVQAFVDGARVHTMPLVRDYKRAYGGDRGPNTGSMGSYSTPDHLLPYVTDTDLKSAASIMMSTVREIKAQTGQSYKGVLYGQFMRTVDGVRVVEYNARFGDPEAVNVLSLIGDAMDSVCQGVIDNSVRQPTFEKRATVCVYVVPEGYPGENTVKDQPVEVTRTDDAEIYMASVYERDGRI